MTPLDTPLRLAEASSRSPIVGDSPAMSAVMDQVARAAVSDARVLVTGESGVGKDLVAREIHRCSSRASLPFVAVNCAGVTDLLLESEFFGHVRGGFTDAHRDRCGKLRQAHRGTLFLDEVGDIPHRMQSLLLRFLDDGLVQPVGSDEPETRVDVRIVAATHRNLLDMVRAEDFHHGLLYRLRVLHIAIPPLRERREDIAELVEHFSAAGRRPITLTGSALRLLEDYSWPGNVRELRNVVEQLLWLAPRSRVDEGDLPEVIRDGATAPRPEQRYQPVDDLFEGLVSGTCSFWTHVHAPFLARDLTRRDVRSLVARGLRTVNGRYRDMVRLFRIADAQYARFMSFLAAFECKVDYREFRRPAPDTLGRRPVIRGGAARAR